LSFKPAKRDGICETFIALTGYEIHRY